MNEDAREPVVPEDVPTPEEKTPLSQTLDTLMVLTAAARRRRSRLRPLSLREYIGLLTR